MEWLKTRIVAFRWCTGFPYRRKRIWEWGAQGEVIDPKDHELHGLISSHFSNFLPSHGGLASWAGDTQDLVFGLVICRCHSEILNFIIEFVFCKWNPMRQQHATSRRNTCNCMDSSFLDAQFSVLCQHKIPPDSRLCGSSEYKRSVLCLRLNKKRVLKPPEATFSFWTRPRFWCRKKAIAFEEIQRTKKPCNIFLTLLPWISQLLPLRGMM